MTVIELIEKMTQHLKEDPDIIDLEDLFVDGIVEEHTNYEVEEVGELFIIVNGHYFNHNEYEVVDYESK